MTVALVPPTPVAGPPNAITDDETGLRWYVFGDERFLSVTSAFHAIAKGGLVIWSATLAAENAFIELPTIVTASRKKPCERTSNRCKHDDWRIKCERCPCGECKACVTKWLADRHRVESRRRADEGTRTHDVIEWWVLHGGEIRGHDNDIRPYVAAFEAWVAEYGLTPDSFLFTEGTVINRADRFAGTTDGAIRFDSTATEASAKLVARVLRARGEYAHIKTGAALVKAVVRDGRSVVLLVDWKTREKPEPRFYPEQALQLTGYRWSPMIRIKGTDVEVPMPDTDGGVIVQLRPDGATPRLAVTDERTYAAFLNALNLCRWFIEDGAAAVSSRSFSLERKDDPAVPEPVKVAPSSLKSEPFALVNAARAPLTDADIPF